MSSIYGPMGAPNYRGISPGELMTSAFDQPLSIGTTFWDQAKGGVLQSFGLGTAVREVMTPDKLEVPPVGETPEQTAARLLRVSPSTASSYGAAVGTAAGLQLNEQRSLSEDQWRSSPFYRDGIPFDRGMTNERAQALAEFYDAQKVRDFYAQKRPVTAFFGNITGQAADPINYVPIAGPAVKAAAVARTGRMLGSVLTSAADAALNTGIAAVATAPARAQFGDDVSWQETVSQIATAALIGGAFGGIFGKIESFRENRALARAQESLATLKRVQEARLALNDAVTGLAQDGDVRLGETSAGLVRQAATEADRATTLPPIDEANAVLPAQDGPAAMSNEVEALFREQVFAQSPELQARYAAAEAKFQEVQARVTALEEPLAARRQSDAAALIDQQSADRLRQIEAELEAKPSARRAAELERERGLIVESLGPEAIAKAENDFRIGPEKKLKAARKSLATARQEFSRARSEVRTAAEQIRATNVAQYRAQIDTAPAKAAPVNEPTPEAQVAAARVGKPEMTPDLAQQHGVNPDTGEFPEQADVEFLRSAGRLAPEEETALADADKTLEIGSAYGEAIKAAVRCLL